MPVAPGGGFALPGLQKPNTAGRVSERYEPETWVTL
jgi:hypothetical protein